MRDDNNCTKLRGMFLSRMSLSGHFRPSYLVAALAAFTVCACGGGDDPPEVEPPPEPPPPAEPVDPGDLTTWAGEGTQGHDGDGQPLAESWFNQPMEVVFAGGTAYVIDWNNHCVRRTTADGTLETIIGTDIPGDWPCQEPGNAAYCEVPLDQAVLGTELPLNHPMDLAVAPDGTVYLAAWHNHKIESYDPASGEVRIVAGQQSPGGAMMGMTTTPDEGGPASAAKLNFPSSIVLDGSGALLVADQRTNRLRRIAPDGDRIISTFAGLAGPPGFDGDAGPASAAHLALSPRDEAGGSDNPPPGGAIALDGSGNLYVADTYNHCVRSIAPGSDGLLGTGDPAEELIQTIAGRCMESGYTGDGDLANAAALNHPFDLEIAPDGALYIADTGNSAVRRVDLAAGTIETVAGPAQPASRSMGCPRSRPSFHSPTVWPSTRKARCLSPIR